MANEQPMGKSQVAEEVSTQLKPVLTALSRLGQDFAEALESRNPKTVKFGRYSPNNVFHPGDKAKSAQFKRGREYFQCGTRLTDSNIFDGEIELLNQITHSGSYIDDTVKVNIEHNGDDERVSISWPCSTPDIMNEMRTKFRSFKECLQMIVEAQAGEQAKLEERKVSGAQR